MTNEVKAFREKHNSRVCVLRAFKPVGKGDMDREVILRCDYHGEEVETHLPYAPFCRPHNWHKCAGEGYCKKEMSCVD